MKLVFGKGKKVEENIFNYLDVIRKEKEVFFKYISEYIQFNKLKHSKKKSTSVHFYESKADDLKRKIEIDLYSKSLLPEFRGDIIRLMERLDKLPNKCQSIIYMISLQKMKIPKKIKTSLLELVKINIKTIDEVYQLISALFRDPKRVQDYYKKIDQIESSSDKKEREIIAVIFSLDSIDKADCILLKELVLEIGSISDYGERIADMVTIINFKVRV